MEHHEIKLTIMTEDPNVFTMLFGNDAKNTVSLGPGIIITYMGTEGGKINTTIQITRESIKEYRPELGLTVVANIISAWLVYRLTGRNLKLEINGILIELRKLTIRDVLEKELKKLNLVQ